MTYFSHFHIAATCLIPFLCVYGILIFSKHRELRPVSVLLGAIALSRAVLAGDILVQIFGLVKWSTYGSLWLLLTGSDVILFGAIAYFILEISGWIRR